MSEALAKELPMAIFKPIPGQEERNLDFLLNFGACMKISKIIPVYRQEYSLSQPEAAAYPLHCHTQRQTYQEVKCSRYAEFCI